MDLFTLLGGKRSDIQEISNFFNELMAELTPVINGTYTKILLAKGLRSKEPLPTEPRQLSSYRTRLGTMLEYAINQKLNEYLTVNTRQEFNSTLVSSNQYPDIYIRDKNLNILLRIEVKSVDAESDEQAARFDVPTHLIDPKKDLLLIVAWNWDKIETKGKEIGEFPSIFNTIVVPSMDIANERDHRLKITKGKIINGNAFVFSKEAGKLVPDPGNYGKFWRIVHGTRIASKNDNESINLFIKFLKSVDKRAPRNRMSN